MKSLPKHAYICLALCLLLMAGCEAMRKQAGAETGPPTCPPEDAQVPECPTVQPQAVAVEVTQTHVDGMATYSKVYPCGDCSTVQLDKKMPNEVEASEEFEYSITVTNVTDTTLANVVLTEEIPDGFKYTSAKPSAEIDGDEIIWRMESLRPKESLEVTIAGVASDLAELQYCTTVTTPVSPMCARIAVVKPRLEFERIISDGVLLCDVIPVRYVVRNVGTGSAHEVKIVDTLPEGLTTTDGLSELAIDVGTLAPGQSKEFQSTLRAAKAGSYVTSAVASTADGLKVETEPVTTIVGQPVLAIEQTGPEKEYLGRSVTYEVTVSNVSDAPAKNTVIESEIPTNITSMKTTAGAKLVGSKLIWRIGVLGPNTSKTVKASFTPTGAGTLVNRATATSECAESVTATTKTEIKTIPAVLLEVVDVEDPVEVGDRSTYVIQVTNQGSATSKNISIICMLEDNMEYLSSTGATSGTVQGNTITFEPLDVLSRKSRATWKVTIKALTAGDVRFKVILQSDDLERPVEESEATRIYE